MNSNLKLSGQNIAAAAIIVAFFFPWISFIILSLSGFDLFKTAVSPGMMGEMMSGFARLLMLFLVLIPLCGAFIIWHNYKPNPKFQGYFKMAQIIPLVVLIVEVLVIIFKLVRGGSSSDNDSSGGGPSVFDILGIGIYLTLAGSIYLFLIGRGIVKDKIFSGSNTTPVAENTPPASDGMKENNQ
jgi:hypothetical protein